jgi:chromosome segregation ATPase
MTKYITATVVVERLIVGNRFLLVEGNRLSLLMTQLSACDRETAILEREIRHLKTEIQRLRLKIQQRDVEIYRLQAVAQGDRTSC